MDPNGDVGIVVDKRAHRDSDASCGSHHLMVTGLYDDDPQERKSSISFDKIKQISLTYSLQSEDEPPDYADDEARRFESSLEQDRRESTGSYCLSPAEVEPSRKPSVIDLKNSSQADRYRFSPSKSNATNINEDNQMTNYENERVNDYQAPPYTTKRASDCYLDTNPFVYDQDPSVVNSKYQNRGEAIDEEVMKMANPFDFNASKSKIEGNINTNDENCFSGENNQADDINRADGPHNRPELNQYQQPRVHNTRYSFNGSPLAGRKNNPAVMMNWDRVKGCENELGMGCCSKATTQASLSYCSPKGKKLTSPRSRSVLREQNDHGPDGYLIADGARPNGYRANISQPSITTAPSTSIRYGKVGSSYNGTNFRPRAEEQRYHQSGYRSRSSCSDRSTIGGSGGGYSGGNSVGLKVKRQNNSISLVLFNEAESNIVISDEPESYSDESYWDSTLAADAGQVDMGPNELRRHLGQRRPQGENTDYLSEEDLIVVDGMVNEGDEDGEGEELDFELEDELYNEISQHHHNQRRHHYHQAQDRVARATHEPKDRDANTLPASMVARPSQTVAQMPEAAAEVRNQRGGLRGPVPNYCSNNIGNGDGDHANQIQQNHNNGHHNDQQRVNEKLDHFEYKTQWSMDDRRKEGEKKVDGTSNNNSNNYSNIRDKSSNIVNHQRDCFNVGDRPLIQTSRHEHSSNAASTLVAGGNSSNNNNNSNSYIDRETLHKSPFNQEARSKNNNFVHNQEDKSTSIPVIGTSEELNGSAKNRTTATATIGSGGGGSSSDRIRSMASRQQDGVVLLEETGKHSLARSKPFNDHQPGDEYLCAVDGQSHQRRVASHMTPNAYQNPNKQRMTSSIRTGNDDQYIANKYMAKEASQRRPYAPSINSNHSPSRKLPQVHLRQHGRHSTRMTSKGSQRIVSEQDLASDLFSNEVYDDEDEEYAEFSRSRLVSPMRRPLQANIVPQQADERRRIDIVISSPQRYMRTKRQRPIGSNGIQSQQLWENQLPSSDHHGLFSNVRLNQGRSPLGSRVRSGRFASQSNNTDHHLYRNSSPSSVGSHSGWSNYGGTYQLAENQGILLPPGARPSDVYVPEEEEVVAIHSALNEEKPQVPAKRRSPQEKTYYRDGIEVFTQTNVERPNLPQSPKRQLGLDDLAPNGNIGLPIAEGTKKHDDPKPEAKIADESGEKVETTKHEVAAQKSSELQKKVTDELPKPTLASGCPFISPK